MNETVGPHAVAEAGNEMAGTGLHPTVSFRRQTRRGFQSLALALIANFSAVPVHARTAEFCDHAARQASAESGVPVAVLQSVTRTETGRLNDGRLQPWPWTVNMEGEGRWFETEDDARAYVSEQFESGARNFDIGCFQVNFRWHGQAFRSLEHMFDPLANARYAAAFLKRLRAETNSWSEAAGTYHSRTPKHAKRYRARFDRIRLSLDNPATPSPDTASFDSASGREAGRNSYPLLQMAGQARSAGSLVPLDKNGGAALIEIAPRANGL